MINPISGGKAKKHIPDLIEEELNHELFYYDIVYTDSVDHARKLSKSAAYLGYDMVVAVGGDGTVNEVARGMIGADAALGIIPFGSGNGLARFMNIPMNSKKAIHVINAAHQETIDSAVFNEVPFFNMAGIGFDAHISMEFATLTSRGFSGYIKTTLKALAGYRPKDYVLTIDGKKYERNAFMISIANSSQYGNDAHIAPHADIKDGLLDVCIVKKFPLYTFPVLAYRLMTKTADKSSYVEIIKGKDIHIARAEAGAIHLDGEPREMDKEISIKVNPLSLKMVVPG